MSGAAIGSQPPVMDRLNALEREQASASSLAENRWETVVARLSQLEAALGVADPTAPQPAAPSPMTATEAAARR
jgi:hypothetical protein